MRGREKKRLAHTKMKGRLSIEKGGGGRIGGGGRTRIEPNERGLVCEVL